MAGSLHELTPWNRRPLTIPPATRRDWLRLAAWEFWMGVLLCGIVGFGTMLVVTAPDRVIIVTDAGNCFASAPTVHPCQRTESGAVAHGVVYRTGTLYALFSMLAGALMFVIAAWLLWELWNVAAPRPITDDFLKLLHDSFARNWRDPRTWPWSRVGWAYGFTFLSASLTAGVAVLVWSILPPSERRRAPEVRVNTSQSFRLEP